MATRFYLTAGIDPGITPAFSTGNFPQTTGAVRRLMIQVNDAGGDALANGAAITSATPGTASLHRQYVSPPLAAGNAFVSGATTFTMQVQGFETAANDNIINRVRVIRIFSQDGGTVRATVKAGGNSGLVTEWNTTARNLTFYNADPATASYTTVDGDRIVVEIGHNDSAGTTPQSTMRFGVTGQTGDLGINETDTTTTLRPWFETSLDLTFLIPDLTTRVSY